MKKLNLSKINMELYSNIIIPLLYQILTLISGFIIPRLILRSYGSSVNGLCNSIAQFLGIMNYAELGVYAVAQSALYAPLARKDQLEVNKIIASGIRFYRKISAIIFFYLTTVVIFYPILFNKQYKFLYTASLIIIIGIGAYIQNYIGAFDKILLISDQKSYIVYIIQIIILIINTVLSCLAIILGRTIQEVKLITVFVYCIKPIIIREIVNHCYKINRKEQYDTEPISQKWNGLAQHASAIILESTDNIVLTCFSTLSTVSIYSVYYLVVHGINILINVVLNSSIQPKLGRIWNTGSKYQIISRFEKYEFVIHFIVTVLYSCTSALIVSFVKVYTSGIKDANYEQPLFATLICTANLFYGLRLPYHSMVKATSKYKETQNSYIICAFINITISCILVAKFGLVGVVIGTFIAMSIQTFWLAFFCNYKLLGTNNFRFLKMIVCDLIIFLTSSLLGYFVKFEPNNYVQWFIGGVVYSVCILIFSILMNLIFNRYDIKKMNFCRSNIPI